jgi:hypothetical protein
MGMKNVILPLNKFDLNKIAKILRPINNSPNQIGDPGWKTLIQIMLPI